MELSEKIAHVKSINNSKDVEAVLDNVFQHGKNSPRMLFDYAKIHIAHNIFMSANKDVESVIVAWLPFADSYRMEVKESVLDVIKEEYAKDAPAAVFDSFAGDIFTTLSLSKHVVEKKPVTVPEYVKNLATYAKLSVV
jgi:hypothetical protein